MDNGGDQSGFTGFDYSQAYYSQQYAQQASYNPAAYNQTNAFPFPGSTSTSTAPRPQVANAYEYDLGAAAQQSVYVPGANVRGGAGGKLAKGGKRTTVLRKGAGKVWEDQTLLEWDPKWFRLFVGDLSNDVNEEVLAAAFNKYKTFTKAKVVRDRLSQKAKYGFVAFSDPEDFLRAWKEMDGKYVGNRPVKLKKAETLVRPVEIGSRKAKQLEIERKQKKKAF